MVDGLRGQRVLITGGLGFIGSNLAHRCVQMGANVTIYDCLDPRSGGNMSNLAGIDDSVETILNDVRNLDGLSASVRNKDIIFNCAAYTSHPNSMKDPIADIEVNCKGVINLLEAVRRFNPKAKIVQVGTSTQIGRMRQTPLDELHPEYPVDIYSANKSASEKYVLIYGSAYGLRTTVVRLANVFGPRSNIRSAEFGFVNFFVGLALQGREIPIFGEGAQLRNVSFVDDCVDALVMAAMNDASDGEVYFAVADRQHTVAQIAEQIVGVIGGSVRYVEWPKDREVIEIGDAIISNVKIKSSLGWSPSWDLTRGLERTHDYFRPRMDDYLS